MKCLNHIYENFFFLKYSPPSPAILLTGDLPNSSCSKFHSSPYHTLSGEEWSIRPITMTSTYLIVLMWTETFHGSVGASFLMLPCKAFWLRSISSPGLEIPMSISFMQVCLTRKGIWYFLEMSASWVPKNVRKLYTGSCWHARFVH